RRTRPRPDTVSAPYIRRARLAGALLLLSVVCLAVVSTRAGVGWVGRPFTYLLTAALGTHVLHLSRLGSSPVFSLTFTLAVLFVLPALRDRVQRIVDLCFGRQPYEAEEVLAAASTALGSTFELRAILQMTLRF